MSYSGPVTKAATAPCTQLHDRASHASGRRASTGERRTLGVLLLTAVTMVGEIVAGTMFGSMALLADGWHMGSHAAALGIALFAYAYARKHADDPRYSFGTGKVNALGGFASAILLAAVAFGMIWEAVGRLMKPVTIAYNDAIIVAVVGLAVNGVSAWWLGGAGHDHGHDDHHHHDDHGHGHHDGHTHSHDSNLRAAYLHVLADALTSVLAIAALLTAKYLGLPIIDPVIGVVGAFIILRWSVGLVRATSRELLDADVPPAMLQRVRESLAAVPDTKVVDLHVWRLGPTRHAAIVSVVSDNPPEVYKRLLANETALSHVTVEVNPATK